MSLAGETVAMYALKSGYPITKSMWHDPNLIDPRFENDIAMIAAFYGRPIEEWMLRGRVEKTNKFKETLADIVKLNKKCPKIINGVEVEVEVEVE